MTAQKPLPLPGTRPQGTSGEREAAARVRDMFTRIAPRYDFLNHLLSFSLDRIWRRRTAKRFLHILRRPDARVLDLCCGTGDLAFALDRARSEGRGFNPAVTGEPDSGVSTAEAARRRVPIIGSDFVEAMLARAQEKAHSNHHAAVFAAADALHLPFPDASFDLVTTAFGFRNLANYEDGLREFARVLKRSGELGILEFTEPGSGPLAGIFRFYFRRVLPVIGGTISGDREAYAYLPNSVRQFPSPSELAALMERVGFTDVRTASWNFGTVILHSARRV
ncbi:MAG: bifunctional demethylmenaquinone methyltransferase/2-methoxy-6-polyprenyl-1,4-benzoquinol methylase UbiE [Acidobacteriia bacterium]|nr:bifunctional demethylmenaquinone methyltransferase/2-methoxy-6-polyprenyl-1,4-benzoquinol methylase UbiE [Terriglobia bacterium]